MNQDARKCPFLNLKNRKSIRSLSNKHPVTSGLFAPIERHRQRGKRAFFGILKRGSLTVEAALAVPIFIFTVICITSLMGVYSGTLRKMTSLRDTCEKTAMAASAVNSEIWIDISAPQDFKPYFMPSAVTLNMVMCRGRARCWTGRDKDSSTGLGDGSGHEYVYLAEHGEVYHTSSKCTYLDLSIQGISKGTILMYRNSSGSKYRECERCVGEEGASDVVYITEDGTKYHNSTSCSGLKRTVKMVDVSEVDSMKECSRCASHNHQ